MLKRVIPIVSVLSILVALFAIPASAADKTVLNYFDYSYGTGTSFAGDKIVYWRLPDEYCAVQTIDNFGNQYLDPGVFSGSLLGYGDVGYKMAVCAYWPSGHIGGHYLSADNFVDETEVVFDFDFAFSDYGYHTTVEIYFRCRIQYFDADYNFIGYDSSDVKVFTLADSEFEYSNFLSLEMNIPVDCKYLGFYSTFNFQVIESDDTEFEVIWSISNPYFESHIPAKALVSAESSDLDDGVLWLRDVANAFLSFEFYPGFSFNEVLYFVLIIGLLFWFIKVVS